MNRLTAATLFLLAGHGLASAHADDYPPAVDTILELFDTADAVLLGERHLSRQDADFRNALISDPRFAAKVGKVLVEFGNARYQKTLDRFLLDLKPVPRNELATVWRNTSSKNLVWDSPVYEEFYRTVRRVNETLAPEARIRVVAAGLPIDWSRVEVWEDLLFWGQRGWWFTRQIEREVITKGEKALVIIGLGHFLRKTQDMHEDYNTIRRLEALHPDRDFRVVLPFPDRPEDLEAIAERLPEPTIPIWVDGASGPFAESASARFFYEASGTVGEIANGLVYFGSRPGIRVDVSEDFLAENPQYAAELRRRQALEPRLPGSYD